MKRRFSDEQIIGMIKEYEAGVKAQELCRKYGISDATFYKYKAKFGGMNVSDARKLRALEDENNRLKGEQGKPKVKRTMWSRRAQEYEAKINSGDLILIAEVTRDHDLWLISDEVYDTQIWSGTHLSPRQLPDMADRTLVIGSLSKSHAMTGSRIGWIVGPEEALWHLGDLATNTTYGVAGFVQEAALFALQQGEAFEARIAEPFRRRRAMMLRQVEKPRSFGGFWKRERR